MAAIGIIFGGLRAAPAQDPIADVKPVKIEEGDTALRKLLKERYNTAVEEVQATSALYRGGKITLDGVAAAVARLAKAGVEMAQTPAERIEYLQLVLSEAKTMESVVAEKYNAGGESLQAMLQARGSRLDAEIALLREREAAR